MKSFNINNSIFINLFFILLISFVNLSSEELADEIQQYNLMGLYHRVLMNKNEISESEKRVLNNEALYYDQKRTLQEMLKYIGMFKRHKNRKMVQIANSIEAESVGLFERIQLGNFEQKLVRNCEFRRFSNRVVDELDTLWKGDRDWRRIRDTVRKTIVMDTPFESFNCEDPEMAETFLKVCSQTPMIEKIHINSINQLMKKFTSFSEFIKESAFEFPGIKNIVYFEDGERIKLYREILDPKTNAETQVKSEFIMSLKMLIGELERKFRENPEAELTIGHITVVLKIMELFTDNPLHIMSLFLVRNHQIMDDMVKNQEEKWKNEECFEVSPEESFKIQRNMLADLHFEFFAQYFAKNETNDEIAEMLRNISGAMALLGNLIGDTSRLVAFWESREIREKLMSKKYKMRLLEHYSDALASSSLDTKLANKFSADIFVFMTHLNSVGFPIPDVVWLFFRISYDQCQVSSKNMNFGAFSNTLRNVILKVDDIISRQTFGQNKSQKEQNKLENFIRDQLDLQLIDLDDSIENLMELVKNYHFETLQNFVNHEMDDDSVGKFLTFLGVLRESKKHCRNLLQFMDLNQIEKFFGSNGLKFDQQDFQAEMAKTKQKVGGKNINADSPGSSDSRKGGVNKKKKENKKKGKQ